MSNPFQGFLNYRTLHSTILLDCHSTLLPMNLNIMPYNFVQIVIAHRSKLNVQDVIKLHALCYTLCGIEMFPSAHIHDVIEGKRTRMLLLTRDDDGLQRWQAKNIICRERNSTF